MDAHYKKTYIEEVPDNQSCLFHKYNKIVIINLFNYENDIQVTVVKLIGKRIKIKLVKYDKPFHIKANKIPRSYISAENN